MKKNVIIVLETKERYIILDVVEYENKKYYLGMGILDNDEIIPEKIAFFDTKKENENTLVAKINNPEILKKLIQNIKN